jgi:hypothetical protein
MSVAKHYQLLAWQVARIENMIRILGSEYSPFVNATCLNAFSEQLNQGYSLIQCIQGIEDIKFILADMTEEIRTGGWHPTVDQLAIMIVIITKFLKQCQAIIRLQRDFRHRYYQPSGLGYQRAHANFTQLKQASQ